MKKSAAYDPLLMHHVMIDQQLPRVSINRVDWPIRERGEEPGTPRGVVVVGGG